MKEKNKRNPTPAHEDKERRQEKTTADLPIRNVPLENFRKINAICSHIGINRSDFMKMRIVDIIKSYPEHMHLRKQ